MGRPEAGNRSHRAGIDLACTERPRLDACLSLTGAPRARVRTLQSALEFLSPLGGDQAAPEDRPMKQFLTLTTGLHAAAPALAHDPRDLRYRAESWAMPKTAQIISRCETTRANAR